MKTWIQNAFAPLKRNLPQPLSNAIPNITTAAFTPFFLYYRQGFFRSAFATRAIWAAIAMIHLPVHRALAPTVLTGRTKRRKPVDKLSSTTTACPPSRRARATWLPI